MRTIIFFFSFATMLWWGGRSVFIEETILYPSNGNGLPRFGISVAISSDGSRALVGAYWDGTEGFYAGAAYVFDVNPSNPGDWMEQTILYPSNGNGEFGNSVALSSDGSRALVGAYLDDTVGTDAGAAYMFDVNPSNSSDWMEQTVLYPSIGTGGPQFGISVALSSDGSRALVGAYLDDTVGINAGSAYVFHVNPSNPSDWMEQTILYPSNGTGQPFFGNSVALSSDGSRALVGARLDDTVGTDAGAAYVFDVNPSNASDWMEQTILYPSNGNGEPFFGNSVALSSDGSRALVGASFDDTVGEQAGSVHVFDVNPSNASDWMLQTVLYPSNRNGQPKFGWSVAISSDGERVLVSAPVDDTVGINAGSAYVFHVNPSNASDWMEQTILYPSNGNGEPFFGYFVALSSDGSRVLVGAYGDDTEGADAGAAYVFDPRCPSGFILINDGTACEQCPVGFIPNDDGLECEPCPDGTIANNSTCESCPAGQIPNEDQSECQSCPIGSIPNDDGLECEPCPDGTISSNSSICESCPAGQIPNENQSECQSCPIGKEPNGKQTKCVGDDDGRSNNVPLIAGLSVAFGLICCLILMCCIVIVVILCILGIVGGGVTIGIPQGAKRPSIPDEEDELFTMRKTFQSSVILADQQYLIDYGDLEIENPPIGQGAFGVVNLGHYKGTRVGEVDHLSKLHRAIMIEFVARGSLYDIIHRDPGILNWKRIRKISGNPEIEMHSKRNGILTFSNPIDRE